MSDTEEEIEEVEVFDEEKYLIFTLLGKLYAFPSRFVGEIALYDTVYPLPLLPEYVLGIINRYSVPYALIDIGILLQKEGAPMTKVLVLKESIDKIAFLIDEVVDIVDVPQIELLKIEQEAEAAGFVDVIEGFFKWRSGDVFVLDVKRIISHIIDESTG
jgi:purine-binding chemotaxis protein CheW